MLERKAQGVMVTGATTPLGSALIRRLLLEPHIEKILAIGAEKQPAELAPLLGERVHYMAVDLTRERSLRGLLFGEAARLSIDTVLHTATHRWARDHGKKIHHLNVEATRQLLQLCEQHPTIKRFIYRGFSEVYDIAAQLPVLIKEDHALELSPKAPQWVRDRVAADLMVCTRMGMSPLQIIVLRCAECVAAQTGSQIYDYLSSRVCLQPLGYDPILNLLSLPDLTEALWLALSSPSQGIFNIPGADTLPLSAIVRKAERLRIALPGPLVDSLYRARSLVRKKDFRYDLNRERFHLSAVLDGSRAAKILRYQPRHPINWTRIKNA